MDFLGFANTELSLGLGLIHSTSSVVANNNRSSSDDHHNYPLEPSLTLTLSGGTDSSLISNSTTVKEEISNYQVLASHEESEIRAVEINMTSCEEEEEDDDDEDGGGVNGRKKLRLTKSQSGLLEEAFKLHPTLNPKQKQELARDLKLRPRQVEVWFQNRRARRKLKQTEVECEYLKKWCKTLTEENQRLRREVQQLKAQKPDLYMQLPAATLTICPSCEHHTNSATTTTTTTKSPFIMKPYFFNPFTSSSAAC